MEKKNSKIELWLVCSIRTVGSKGRATLRLVEELGLVDSVVPCSSLAIKNRYRSFHFRSVAKGISQTKRRHTDICTLVAVCYNCPTTR